MLHDETFAFGFRAVQDKVPKASGIYTIYSSRRWLYVGESDDLQDSLFGLLNDRAGFAAHRGPLSFSFEVVSPAERVGRQQALVAALAPVYNARSADRGAGAARA